MNYKDILNSNYFNETYSKIKELKKDFPVDHAFVHINNVIEYGKMCASIFNLNNKQKELLLIACCLHDIGYLNGRDNHAYTGSVLAKEFLLSNGFNNEDTNAICMAISNHGGKELDNFSDPISLCLAISDKLDFASSRYRIKDLEYPSNKIFPFIEENTLCYENNNLILKIKVRDGFDEDLFMQSNYYKKLNNFFKLVCEVLNSSFNIIYLY